MQTASQAMLLAIQISKVFAMQDGLAMASELAAAVFQSELSLETKPRWSFKWPNCHS